jgi:hypothetical protein
MKFFFWMPGADYFWLGISYQLQATRQRREQSCVPDTIADSASGHQDLTLTTLWTCHVDDKVLAEYCLHIKTHFASSNCPEAKTTEILNILSSALIRMTDFTHSSAVIKRSYNRFGSLFLHRRHSLSPHPRHWYMNPFIGRRHPTQSDVSPGRSRTLINLPPVCWHARGGTGC